MDAVATRAAGLINQRPLFEHRGVIHAKHPDRNWPEEVRRLLPEKGCGSPGECQNDRS
jgi:hypothetical protein